MTSPGWSRAVEDPPGAAGRPSVFLHPGHLFASSAPHAVTTIVGSCVAVMLWDPDSRLGGVNHFLLPRGGTAPATPLQYGDAAVEALVAELIKLGGRKRMLQAKVFGGACINEAFRDGRRHLGEQNVDAAMEGLAAHQIPVWARDVGGNRGRKVVFHTDDGRVWVKTL